MGGGSYDRLVFGAESRSGAIEAGCSTEAERVLAQDRLHPDMDPRGRSIGCDSGTPIVVALDVTGSMGSWAKVVYDKLPMFFGQLTMQGYCNDPAISFAAVGDAGFDTAPVQVSEFARGIEIEGQVSKMYLEGGGGSNSAESYDLVCAFYASDRCVRLPAGETKPFFFVTGDEYLYETVNAEWVQRWVDPEATGFSSDDPWSLDALFAQLNARYEVFLLKKDHPSARAETLIRAQWQRLLGTHRVLHVENPRAVVDIMLGAIALCAGQRTLSGYLVDMGERGQTVRRRMQVRTALADLASTLHAVGADVEGAVGKAGTDERTQDRWADHLLVLNSMGFFEDEISAQLLQRHGGSVQAVVNSFLGT